MRSNMFPNWPFWRNYTLICMHSCTISQTLTCKSFILGWAAMYKSASAIPVNYARKAGCGDGVHNERN